MMQFAWGWAFLSLPLPWLAKHFLKPAAQQSGAALKVPFYAELETLTAAAGSGVRGENKRISLIAWLIWLLLVIAAARPQWLGEPIALPVSGRDLLLAVDLSESLRIPDMSLNGKQVDRLQAIKQVVSEFIKRRHGDRLGLILFGEQAYLQTPLTFDLATIAAMLNEAEIGLAGKSTAIGDAIGLAVKRLRERPEKNRVLILLTDGANTAGEVEPLKAAELAAQSGIKIYPIGVGADELLIRDFFGARRVNPSQDLDEKTLQAIAETTGGKYFRARDTESLAEIYRLLDQLELIQAESETFRPLSEFYPWPLGAAFLLSLWLAFRR